MEIANRKTIEFELKQATRECISLSSARNLLDEILCFDIAEEKRILEPLGRGLGK